MARTVEEITTASGVEVEKDAGDDDDLLLETGLEEVEAVGNRAGQAFEVEPEVERAVRHVFDHKAHVTQALNYVITLVLCERDRLVARHPVRMGVISWTYSEVAL